VWPEYLVAVAVVAFITLATFPFAAYVGGSHGAALILLLGVVVVGYFLRRGPTLLAAALSALVWDFFLLPPVYAFRISNVGDALLLGMYFTVAIIIGQLTTRIRAQQEIERLRQERATALYLLTLELSEDVGLERILHRAARQMERAFGARVSVLIADSNGALRPLPGENQSPVLALDEYAAAAWVLKKNQRAGRFTLNHPNAEALYAPLVTSSGSIGVVGLRLAQSFPPTSHQLSLLDAFLQQITLALDRNQLRQISETARLLAESERLSKTLLDSVSHEIQTPIAVIQSAVSNLAHVDPTEPWESHQAIVSALEHATARLNRLVGNVLEMTRLESGHVKPRLNECDVRDLLHTALSHTEKELAGRPVEVEIPPELPIIPMDFVLMEQALANLLVNAAGHTPSGTAVRLAARVENDFLIIQVADRGPGIPPESLSRVFEKFYRGPSAPTGGSGLGLSLVKGFVEAQGGQVTAGNRPEGGAVFTIRMPLANIPPVVVETLS